MTEKSGFAIWLTGLPASGKTTLARSLAGRLSERGLVVQILDSDELRQQLTPDPTYSPQERQWFYDTIVWLAQMLIRNGINVLIAATGPRRDYRQAARQQISRFAEVYVQCTLSECRRRDPKGLWAKSDRGEIDDLPGAGAPYEAPESPEMIVDSENLSATECVNQIIQQLQEQNFLQ